MANLETYFNNSQPLDEYIDSMTVNKDNVLTIYNAFTLPSSDDRINQLKDSSYSKVLVISERLVRRRYDELTYIKAYKWITTARSTRIP